LRVKVISINLYVFHLNVMDDLKLHTIREIYVYFGFNSEYNAIH